MKNKNEAYKDIIDFFLLDYNDRMLQFQCGIKTMVRNDITPMDLFDHIEELCDDYNEPKEKYEAIMNPWFSNRLTARYEPYFQACENEMFSKLGA